MSKTVKNQPASRPLVDALQYEKLALSAFNLCDRQLSQLDTLITLTASIVRNPAFTHDERKRRQTLLELLLDTAEQYEQDLTFDRELFQVIALDSKGRARGRITAKHAADLLTEAAGSASVAIDKSSDLPCEKLAAGGAATFYHGALSDHIM